MHLINNNDGLNTDGPNASPVPPGQSDGRTARLRRYTFNVIVTGRCNTGCTYCHYYEHRPRRDVWFDISDELYDIYLDTINCWKSEMPGVSTVRFSGGDPIVLGDRIFDLADRCWEATGIRPFMLTAGKSLTRSWVEAARKSHLSGLKVSIENPLDPDPGAPRPQEIIKKVASFNSEDFPVRLGVCVLKPSSFRNLYDIARWFFDEVGHLPVFHEVNYGYYERPTEADFSNLKENIDLILADFGSDGTLSLFPSVSPELSFGGDDPYVFDLDLKNSYQIDPGNIRSKVLDISENLRVENYPKSGCVSRACPWWEFCDNVKWYWKQDARLSEIEKLGDYCRMKKILNDSFYRFLVDADHSETEFKYSSELQI